MTKEFDYKEFCIRQIEWYKKQNEFEQKQIGWINEDIKRERARLKEMVEYIWSKGVLTEMDYRMVQKGYETVDLKRYKNQRARYYRNIKSNNKRIAEYEARLAKH